MCYLSKLVMSYFDNFLYERQAITSNAIMNSNDNVNDMEERIVWFTEFVKGVGLSNC